MYLFVLKLSGMTIPDAATRSLALTDRATVRAAQRCGEPSGALTDMDSREIHPYHLGAKPVKRSTLSEANARRPMPQPETIAAISVPTAPLAGASLIGKAWTKRRQMMAQQGAVPSAQLLEYQIR